MTTAFDEKNYYDVLGVPPDVNYRDLRKAFMRLAAKYDADRRLFPAAGSYYDRAMAAYRVLSDHDSRRRYNADIGLPDPPQPVPRDEDEWWAAVVPDNWYVYAFAFVGLVFVVTYAVFRY